MIKKLPEEVWHQLQFNGYKLLRKNYAISSFGRIASYTQELLKDGKLLTGSLTGGYPTLNLHLEKGNGTIYLHRELAKLFCKQPSPKHRYVIHINHKKADNHFANLQWATLNEVASHQQTSPQKLAYKKLQSGKVEGIKLNTIKVKAIKDAINNPKRKLTFKLLAAKYGISEMTLYRIKRGESWGKVK